jgi:hypothetical protein
MAFPFAPKPRPFTATNLIERIRTPFRAFPDGRRGGNPPRYTMEEAALSAVAVCFPQSPSFLDYPCRMQRRLGRNNAHSRFGVHPLPSDTQMRNRLDSVPPETRFPVFTESRAGRYHRGDRQPFQARFNTVWVAFEGTEYGSSPKLGGDPGAHRTLRQGATLPYPVALTPVIVAPGQETVGPVAPEFGRPQEGDDNQDCELAAAPRWLEHGGGDDAPWSIP